LFGWANRPRLCVLMSISWSPNAGECIQRAYRLLGNLEPPWIPSDDQMTQGIFAFNGLLKGLQAWGINLYRQEQRTITVPALAQSVLITPRVMGVEQVSWVVTPSPNEYKRPMGAFSYVDFFNLPNPESQTTSGPSVYMFDKQNTTSTLWLWPIPTFGGTIIATVGRTVDDINAPTDTVDFPDEWTEAIVYNLADRLMDDQAVANADPQTAQRIAVHAGVLLQRLMDFDRPNSLFLRPYGKPGESRIWR